jgi:hypothetical protein
MPECLPEWLRIEKNGIIEVPLLPVKDVHRFGMDRQKEAECQHSIGSQHNEQKSGWPTSIIVLKRKYFHLLDLRMQLLWEKLQVQSKACKRLQTASKDLSR